MSQPIDPKILRDLRPTSQQLAQQQMQQQIPQMPVRVPTRPSRPPMGPPTSSSFRRSQNQRDFVPRTDRAPMPSRTAARPTQQPVQRPAQRSAQRPFQQHTQQAPQQPSGQSQGQLGPNYANSGPRRQFDIRPADPVPVKTMWKKATNPRSIWSSLTFACLTFFLLSIIFLTASPRLVRHRDSNGIERTDIKKCFKTSAVVAAVVLAVGLFIKFKMH